MASRNYVELVGNLGSDPEVRTVGNSGNKVANFNIATTETWTDKQTGEKREATEWHRIVLWGKLAELAEKYLRKGNTVLLVGKLQTRKWQDQAGADHYTTEVVLNGPRAEMHFLSKPANDNQAGSQQRQGGQQYSGGGQPQRQQQTPPPDDFSDDIPF